MSLPEHLGRLRRVERIGVGGFASVWLFHDTELDSPVAVKALADNWAARNDVRRRFLEEARILRRADNDHVVRVYDIGVVDETPYFVMSYADRGSVASILDPGVPKHPEFVADLVRQAGIGLDVLHQQGIIHRDIKPHNLLLHTGREGVRAMVADLGMAKAMLHASGLTEVVGTPAYMAPEQATGFGIDARADVHGLGAVAYQMLCGQLPRNGDIASLGSATLPPPPSSYVELPQGVDEVVLRALEPHADRRWSDVLSFSDALTEAVGRPVRASSLPAPAAGAGAVTDAPRADAPMASADSIPLVPSAGTARRRSRGRLIVLLVLLIALCFAAAYAVVALVSMTR